MTPDVASWPLRLKSLWARLKTTRDKWLVNKSVIITSDSIAFDLVNVVGLRPKERQLLQRLASEIRNKYCGEGGNDTD